MANNTINLNKTVSTEGIDETITINVPMYEGFRAEDLYILGQILHTKDLANAQLPKLPDFDTVLQKLHTEKKVEKKVATIESKPKVIKQTNYTNSFGKAMEKATIEAKRDYAKDEKRVEQAFKDTYNKVEHLDANAKPNETVNKLLYVECPHCDGTHIMMSDIETQQETEIKCPKCRQKIRISPLSKMSKMKYTCECGGSGFMHFANTTTTDIPLKQGDAITIRCIKCKEDIELGYNKSNNTFEQ